MQKKSFFASLSSKDRYMVGNLFFLYLIQGVFVILIGSILPMMKEEYGLDYQIGGFLISAHSIGNLLTGLVAGLLPLAIGLKTSLLLQNILPFAGFAITLVTGNPWLLIFALLLTGLGRGAISNYNNQIISTLSGGSAVPLNMLHGFFAIGAVSAPFLALMFTRTANSGWRKAVYVVIFLGVVSMFTSSFMKMDSVPYQKSQSGQSPFGFVKEHGFWHSAFIMFFYLCVEASVMGWMVTYYTDSGVVKADSAQMLTSLLWITIIPMLVGTIGLGLSLSGMYGTTVANAGDVFGRYPLAMGVFITVTNLGSVITPSIVGGIAESFDIRMGMAVLLVPAVIDFVLAVLNHPTTKSTQ